MGLTVFVVSQDGQVFFDLAERGYEKFDVFFGGGRLADASQKDFFLVGIFGDGALTFFVIQFEFGSWEFESYLLRYGKSFGVLKNWQEVKRFLVSYLNRKAFGGKRSGKSFSAYARKRRLKAEGVKIKNMRAAGHPGGRKKPGKIFTIQFHFKVSRQFDARIVKMVEFFQLLDHDRGLNFGEA